MDGGWKMKKVKWWILALSMVIFVSTIPFESVYASNGEYGSIMSKVTENEEGNFDKQYDDLIEKDEQNSNQNIENEDELTEETPNLDDENLQEEEDQEQDNITNDKDSLIENQEVTEEDQDITLQENFEEGNEEIEEKVRLTNLKIRVRVRSTGWMEWTSLEEMAGTEGKAKPIEAIVIKSEDDSTPANAVQYRVHVQDIGWMDWVSLGEIAGTEGKSKQIEAIQFRLSDEALKDYNLYYQTHIAQFGWLGWAQAGEVAGSEGLAKGIECIKIKLLEKENVTDIPDLGGESYIRTSGSNSLRYSGHVRNIGDVPEEKNGEILGTVGRKLALEAVKIRLAIPDGRYVNGGVQYRTHVTNIGWQDWKSNGQLAGTTGKALSIEAIQIRIDGEIAKYYDVYYRAHVQNLGWLGWAKNGQSAGTTKMAYRMEALQVRLVAKGGKVPGNTSGHYKEGKTGWFYEGGYKFYYKSGVKQLDLDGILPKQSSYYIKVNRKQCTVTVYAKDGKNGYIIPVKRFACSVGLASTPTPKGTFYTPAKYRWHVLMGPSYGQYCTRIKGSILFHSVAGRNMTSYNLNARDYNKLGKPASHGCVRLNVRDAKWIYDYCPLKTKVTIYDSSNPGPLGKPKTIKIPAGQTWDPTDPNVKK